MYLTMGRVPETLTWGPERLASPARMFHDAGAAAASALLPCWLCSPLLAAL